VTSPEIRLQQRSFGCSAQSGHDIRLSLGYVAAFDLRSPAQQTFSAIPATLSIGSIGFRCSILPHRPHLQRALSARYPIGSVSMNLSESSRRTAIGGVVIGQPSHRMKSHFTAVCLDWFQQRGLASYVQIREDRSDSQARVGIELDQRLFERWTPQWDTVELADRLGLDLASGQDLVESEIIVAMLASPVAFEFPSLEEFESAVRVRKNIVDAASKTFLSFDAYGAERPDEYWEYDEVRGYVVRPGKPMIEALRLATQPGDTGKVYSFSCYRATEYVIALGLAEEIQRCNGELSDRLQRQSEVRAIRSGEFHEVFMKEYGSQQHPLPAKYYVPGDRVWFKNPDPASADALGFEGSWVFYIGRGRFTDFWKRNQAFTLELKCLEMFHWRHATYRDEEGILRMDEKIVQSRMRASEQDPIELAQIYDRMVRTQDPRGVYADGGCIDPSREYPRWVRPETSDIRLPDVEANR
jgi:hypothetical protein